MEGEVEDTVQVEGEVEDTVLVGMAEVDIHMDTVEVIVVEAGMMAVEAEEEDLTAVAAVEEVDVTVVVAAAGEEGMAVVAVEATKHKTVIGSA